MSIRTRILLFLVFVSLAIVTTGVVSVVTQASTRNYLEGVKQAHQQLEAMVQLAVHANRYSEQIAEVLLLGEDEREDFEGASAQVKAAMTNLYDRTRRVAVNAGHGDVRDRERRELKRLDRMRTMLNEVDDAAKRAFALNGTDRKSEAVALFRDQIENRLDAEFDQMIVIAMANERADVSKAEDDANDLSRRLAVASGLTFLGLLSATLVWGFLLGRSLVGPIGALTEGASAIGQGKLDHRIDDRGSGELALLSRRFNEMASELGERRAEILEGSAALEQQVAQRTEQLELANARLSALDRFRVQFLGEVSHELRTPLTVLRGEAEVSLRGKPKPVQVYRDTLTRIAEQAIEMGWLVDELLTIASTEADQASFEWSLVSLRDVAKEATRDGAVLAARRSMTVALDVPEAPIEVYADPRRLKQTMVIVLDNAVKYSPAGGTIKVQVLAGEELGMVMVWNKGDGIPPEDLPHVFKHFYRGDDARTRVAEGSGLGLPISKRIIEKHGGTITIESEPGSATKVTLNLPLRR
ncbi:sensor histidine kinase [Methylobacterium iners]|uniref:histidine kinase n=1 Tax=Methylobacterium iners TaxID=418707 RepID=A0ABQ4S0I3_9HYPH|nr:ATP-binding protein [Methylobacterium iners]GJD95932.1 Adaptive-response sensory-kinase SasA [Methylobacterium iners]